MILGNQLRSDAQQIRIKPNIFLSGSDKESPTGPNPKYFTISGHRSFRWKACSGTKKSTSVENFTPDHIYHPVVSPCGGGRRPFIGNCCGSKVLLMPILS